jgi:hypothetical protein
LRGLLSLIHRALWEEQPKLRSEIGLCSTGLTLWLVR